MSPAPLSKNKRQELYCKIFRAGSLNAIRVLLDADCISTYRDVLIFEDALYKYQKATQRRDERMEEEIAWLHSRLRYLFFLKKHTWLLTKGL